LTLIIINRGPAARLLQPAALMITSNSAWLQNSSQLRSLSCVCVALSVLVAMGCSSREVRTTEREGAALPAHQTVRWGSTEPVTRNPILDDNIRAEIQEELEEKGYRFIPVDQPSDLIASFRTAVQAYAVPQSTTPVRPDVPPTESARLQRRGKLTLEFVDAKTQEVVWYGVVSDEISSAGPKTEKVEEGIEALLKDFPRHSDEQKMTS
jgi:hypothetical protein